MSQASYDWPHDIGLPGSWSDLYTVQEARSYALQDQLSAWTVTIADPVVTGEVFSFRVVDGENGIDELVEFTVGATQTDDATAAGLAADGTANANLIAAVTLLAAAAVVTIQARDTSQSIDILDPTTDSAAGTIVAAETVVPADADVLPGLAVVLVDGSEGREVRLPTTGDTPTDIVGVVLRSESTLRSNTGLFADTAYPSGSVIPVARKGSLWVEPEGSVLEAGLPVFVRISGTGTIGALRSTDDGADAIELTNARWLTPSRTVNGKVRAKVDLNMPP